MGSEGSHVSTRGRFQDPMSFEAELRSRTRKLEKEQEERRILAKERLERDLRVREESRARRRGIEESQRRRRWEDLAKEEEERLSRESQAICNRGVSYEEELLSKPLEGDVASKKGIRRCNDKVRVRDRRERDVHRPLRFEELGKDSF